MGSCLSGVQNYISGRVHHKILMIGLDASGKSTILYKLKLGKVVCTIPTIGLNVETISPLPGLTFDMWDVGGGDKIRPLKRHYPRTGIVMVVDSADHERFAEAREELVMILEDPQYPGIPVVVMANKQDLPNALAPSEVANALRLHELSTNNPWQIKGTSATNGEGLQEALITLGTMVRQYRKDNAH